MQVLTDPERAALAPLVEACRPKGKTPPRHLRRTTEAILWRHANGAKWRASPAEPGPWWLAAQTCIRWAKLGVWGRLLILAQRSAAARPAWSSSMAPPFGHTPKAAGAGNKGAPARGATGVRRSAARAAATAPRPA